MTATLRLLYVLGGAALGDFLYQLVRPAEPFEGFRRVMAAADEPSATGGDRR